jgi:ubiquinone/menaquinone biosynthesis C-methylase UbiE
MKKYKLNLGCGKDIKKDYINVDIHKLKGVDKIVDLNQKLPFKDNFFDEVFCSHVLEHSKDLNFTLKEIYRILKKDGKLIAIVPHFTNSGFFSDPTHKYFFTFETFYYFVKYSYFNYYYDFGFKKINQKIIFGKKYALWNYLLEPMANIFPNVYENSIFRVFPAQEIKVILIK